MDGKRRSFWGWLDSSVRLLGLAGGIIVLFLMLGAVFIVVMRYIVRNPQAWAFDISVFLMVGLVFLGGAYTLLEGGHIRIDTVTTRLPQTGRLIMDILAMLIVFLFCLFLLSSGITEALANWSGITQTPAMLPTFPSYAIIPVGAFFLCLVCIVFIKNDVKMLLKAKKGE